MLQYNDFPANKEEKSKKRLEKELITGYTYMRTYD